MKKTNPMYFFVMIFGMFMMMFALIIVSLVIRISIPLVIMIGVAFIILMMSVAIKLSSGTFEVRKTVLKDCLSCGKEIPYNSDYCNYCGASTSDEVTCEYCGELNSEKNNACYNCNGLLK